MKWASKLIHKFTSGARKKTHTNALTTSRPRQTISSRPNSRVPFNRLATQTTAFPAKKTEASRIEAVELWLATTPAKLFTAKSSHTTRLKTLGAYLPTTIWRTPTIYDAVPNSRIKIYRNA